MTSETKSRLKDELLAQEREYLRAVQEHDGDTAARLTAQQALVVSGNGAMNVDAAAIRQMIEQHDVNRRYEIDERTVQVLDVKDDVAIIAYKLRTMNLDNNGHVSEAYDTDVWVRGSGGWACALHAEIPASGGG